MTDEQFKQLNAQLGGINGAVNVLAEAVSPVDSSVHQAIQDMSENLAKWQAKQTEVIKNGFELLAEALGSSQKLDAILKNQTTIIDMLSPLGSLPSTAGLMEARLETIHRLVSDLSVDPEKLAQLTSQLKQSTDELDATVKANQPKQS